jgi:alpha-tubulin suppressor-like RCC1 family protein
MGGVMNVTKRGGPLVFLLLAGCPGGEEEEGAANALPLAVGDGFACALLKDASVACWGKVAYGQMGFNANDILVDEATGGRYVLPPKRIEGLPRVKQVSAERDTVCAVSENGDVYCWGDDSAGVTGRPHIGKDAVASTPTRIEGVDHVVEVRTGGGPACARKEDGTVWCWGSTLLGNTGVPFDPMKSVTSPTRIEGIVDAVELDVTLYKSCARHSNGDVSCWGAVLPGPEISITPVTVPNVHHARQIALQWFQSIALLEDGSVMAWGADANGAEIRGIPETIPNLGNTRAVSAQGGNGCALRNDGTVWCWGDNDKGQVGQGVAENGFTLITRAKPVPNLSAVAIAVGETSSCATRTTGDVTCFGLSELGALGVLGPSGPASPGAEVPLPQ